MLRFITTPHQQQTLKPRESDGAATFACRMLRGDPAFDRASSCPACAVPMAWLAADMTLLHSVHYLRKDYHATRTRT